MAADGPGLLVFRGEVRLLADMQFQLALEDVEGKARVKIPLPAAAVDIPQLLRRLFAAADRDLPAADAPQQELDRALEIAQVCLRELLPRRKDEKTETLPLSRSSATRKGRSAPSRKAAAQTPKGRKRSSSGGLFF